jgi:hypothetical protein
VPPAETSIRAPQANAYAERLSAPSAPSASRIPILGRRHVQRAPGMDTIHDNTSARIADLHCVHRTVDANPPIAGEIERRSRLARASRTFGEVHFRASNGKRSSLSAPTSSPLEVGPRSALTRAPRYR